LTLVQKLAVYNTCNYVHKAAGKYIITLDELMTNVCHQHIQQLTVYHKVFFMPSSKPNHHLVFRNLACRNIRRYIQNRSMNQLLLRILKTPATFYSLKGQKINFPSRVHEGKS